MLQFIGSQRVGHDGATDQKQGSADISLLGQAG